MLGIHPAPRSPGSNGRGADRFPSYVRRTVDHELADRLSEPGFVLLVGDALAGKSRTAFEAMRVALPRHRLVAPADSAALDAALLEAAEHRRSVLWLGDLETHLGPTGLTRTALGALLGGIGHHRVVLATMRSAEVNRHTAVDEHADDVDRALLRNACDVLDQAVVVRLARILDPAERADVRRAARADPRIAAAVPHLHRYGLAEFLGAGPVLLRTWQDGWAAGQNPRGAALVAAAVDCRRAGLTGPMPRHLIERLHHHYLDGHGGAALRPEELTDGWTWAIRHRTGTTRLLTPVGPRGLDVFAYLTDSTCTSTPVPEVTLRGALSVATPADASRIGRAAYRQHRFALASTALRRAADAVEDALGAEHPETLRTRESHAVVAFERGAFAAAEAEHRDLLRVRTRDLGPDDPATLRSGHNRAVALHGLGRYREAEHQHRSTLTGRIDLLGCDHPDTLRSRHHLAVLLYRRGSAREAEAELRAVIAVLTAGRRTGSSEVLDARENLANVVSGLRGAAEAQPLHRAVLDDRSARFGAHDLTTLRSRHNVAASAAVLGDHGSAAAELASLGTHYGRVLGAPSTPRR